MDSEKQFDCLKRKLKNNKNTSESIDLTGTYLFISFDLSDSTNFKNENNNWINVFSFFYDYILKEITNLNNKLGNNYNINNKIRPWKKIGDEILFYYPIVEIKTLSSLIKEIYKILSNLIKELKQYCNLKSNISAKATAWIASVEHEEDYYEAEYDKKNNNYILYKDIITRKDIDFLGPDVDVGFRISKYSIPGKITLCAKLAYILICDNNSYNDDIAENIYIISYEKLKGIWRNKHYPIIWYFEKQGCLEKNTDFDFINVINNIFKFDEHDDLRNIINCFSYDDKYKYPIVKLFFDNLDNILREQKYNKKTLNKIINDLNIKNEIDKIYSNIKKFVNNNPSDKIKPDISKDNVSEIHVVAVCINTKDQKILIAKRNDDALWECGCAKMKMDKSFKEILIEGYKNRFNININFIKEQDEVLRPIDIYEYNKKGRIIPGIVFTAIINIEDIKHFDKKHYSEVKLISEQDVSQIPEEKCVKGFHRRIKRAFEYYNKALAEKNIS